MGKAPALGSWQLNTRMLLTTAECRSGCFWFCPNVSGACRIAVAPFRLRRCSEFRPTRHATSRHSSVPRSCRQQL